MQIEQQILLPLCLTRLKSKLTTFLDIHIYLIMFVIFFQIMNF